MKVPPELLQPAPPASVQVPVMVFPFSFPANVSVLPEGEVEVITKLMVPWAVPEPVVVSVEVPVADSVEKHALLLKLVLKLNCVTLTEPSPLTVKFIVKPRTAPDPSPLPPASVALHKPLVDEAAVCWLVCVLLPQPVSNAAHASRTAATNLLIQPSDESRNSEIACFMTKR